MRRINQQGLELIKTFEGTRLDVYKDAVGLPTVGTGHLVKPEDHLKLGDRITQERADDLLSEDLEATEAALDKLIPLDATSNQFSACVSFSFNCGVGAFRTSTLLRRMNAGEYGAAANEFLKWDHAGGKKLAGLTRRREAERKLFLTPDKA